MNRSQIKYDIIKWILALLLGIQGLQSTAQDIQFSQYYAVPMFLNPAFAGSAHNYRGILHQRIQWPGLDAKYTSSLFSVDGYSSRYHSGFGLMFIQDYQGSSVVSSSQFGLQYAYELHLNERFTVRAGLQADYISRYLDYSTLRFPSQFNDSTGFSGLNSLIGNPRKGMLDLSSGLVLYSRKMWASVASNHMNMPNQSFVGTISRLPLKMSFTAGYKISLYHRKEVAYLEEEKDISITPTVHYKFQGKSDQLDLGVYGIYDKFVLATWYRGIPFKKYNSDLPNNESIVVITGYTVGAFSLTYSYDFTISKLATARTSGAHEINITYIHKHHPKVVKPMRRMPCPNFYRENRNLQPHHEVRPTSHPHIR